MIMTAMYLNLSASMCMLCMLCMPCMLCMLCMLYMLCLAWLQQIEEKSATWHGMGMRHVSRRHSQ